MQSWHTCVSFIIFFMHIQEKRFLKGGEEKERKWLEWLARRHYLSLVHGCQRTASIGGYLPGFSLHPLLLSRLCPRISEALNDSTQLSPFFFIHLHVGHFTLCKHLFWFPFFFFIVIYLFIYLCGKNLIEVNLLYFYIKLFIIYLTSRLQFPFPPLLTIIPTLHPFCLCFSLGKGRSPRSINKTSIPRLDAQAPRGKRTVLQKEYFRKMIRHDILLYS